MPAGETFSSPLTQPKASKQLLTDLPTKSNLVALNYGSAMAQRAELTPYQSTMKAISSTIQLTAVLLHLPCTMSITRQPGAHFPKT